MEPILVVLATLATLGRVWALIGLSIISGWALAFFAIRSRAFESAYVPLVNAFESIPVIAFLPIVLVVFVSRLGGPLGSELAADFLVFDAVAWNIWIGAYQSFKTVPEHLGEVAENYNFGVVRTLWKLFIPHSIPRITSNLFSSFADALFYISVSEVFTIGLHTYSTFGIGTLIVQFTRAGDSSDLALALIAIGVSVVLTTLLLSHLSRKAIARYGLDTRGDITTRPGPANARARWLRAFGGPRRRISARLTRTAAERDRHTGNLVQSRSRAVVKWAGIAVLLGLAAYLLYGSARLVMSVPVAEWDSLFSQTPFLLLSMGADYLRVFAVAGAALAVSITLGYYLATHARANSIVAPVVQTVAAFPAPTYFPIFVGATIGFLVVEFPFGYVELYVFILGFLSCFYYVFFDFWIGVQAIPSEFWEVMENHELTFGQRMRRVILPATFPYLVTGISSTINSAWAGIAIGEFWPDIVGNRTLVVKIGMMKFIGENLAAGNVASAAWVSLLFAVVVIFYGLFFTRNLMDLARRRYVVEEGVYAG